MARRPRQSIFDEIWCFKVSRKMWPSPKKFWRHRTDNIAKTLDLWFSQDFTRWPNLKRQEHLFSLSILVLGLSCVFPVEPAGRPGQFPVTRAHSRRREAGFPCYRRRPRSTTWKSATVLISIYDSVLSLWSLLLFLWAGWQGGPRQFVLYLLAGSKFYLATHFFFISHRSFLT